MSIDPDLHHQLRTTYLNAAPGLGRAAVVEDMLRVFYAETKSGSAGPIDQDALSPVVDAAAAARTSMLNNPATAHNMRSAPASGRR